MHTVSRRVSAAEPTAMLEFAGIACHQSSKHPSRKVVVMSLSIAHLQPLVALGAGILILIMPRLLNYIVAIYLIVVGITGLGLFK